MRSATEQCSLEFLPGSGLLDRSVEDENEESCFLRRGCFFFVGLVDLGETDK
jgi:hypothetical protein